MKKSKGKAKIKVGVVRGGPSSEYDVSLKTGGEVLKALPEDYEGHDVLLSKNGEWYIRGFKKEPSKIFETVDVIFNALHGEFGEDGKSQQYFEAFNMPYTGSRIVPSSFAMNKHKASNLLLWSGLKVPEAIVFEGDDFFGLDPEYCASEAVRNMPPPWVCKPSSAGSSVGINICNSFHELANGISEASRYGNTVMVEEYIKGTEATCGVLEGYRGEDKYALPVVEIIPPENEFFNYKVKYDGSTREICPASFKSSVKKEIESLAIKAHELLGCRHYSRADFIVSDKGVYILEVNTLPGLTSESLFPKAANAAGLEFPHLLDHLVKLALNNKG
ncbi:D-alanine--D-alanine ligase [Patescibacteria group bacterium]